jgi:putative flippase GtrA
MTSALSETFTFLLKNDLKTILTRVRNRDVPPFVQFMVYATCGVIATVIHQGLVAVLSFTAFPALKGMVVDGVALTEEVRKHNLLLNNILAFPFGAVAAYFTNILFVFTPGRHSKLKEMALFFGVAACGFFPGLWVIDFLVGRYQVPSSVAQLAFVFTSFMVNYAMRKFVIFKG